MNLQAQADAMFKAAEEFKNCKRNAKSGKINENSKHAVKVRLVKKLMEAGEDYANSWAMAHELGKKYN